MLQVTEEIKKEFYESIDAISESLLDQYAEMDGEDPQEWSEDDIQEHTMNMLDDGHPDVFECVKSVFEPILGRVPSQEEMDWFIDEGLYIKK